MRGLIARQFGRPSGLLGLLVGRMMARSNADFSRWTVGQLREQAAGAVSIVELGPGPGIGLEELLRAFPEAKIWGVDLSTAMLAESRRRNSSAVKGGRLSLIEGGVAAIAELAPADVVAANHVLYFWRDPAHELKLIGQSLRPGGLLALGYQLRHDMPPVAQRQFPRQGFRLYDTEDEVNSLLRSAGFTRIVQSVMGSSERPGGRLALAATDAASAPGGGF